MNYYANRIRDNISRVLGCGIIATVMIAAMFHGFAAAAEEDCPSTPAELAFALTSDDAVARAQASECFIEEAIFFEYEDLKHVVKTMLNDDSAEVRYNGLSTLAASVWAAKTTANELWKEKAGIIQILNEDPVAGNKSGAAVLIGQMDPIPVNQVEQPLLDLLSHSDSSVVNFALKALLEFPDPPKKKISQALLAMTGHGNAGHRGVARMGLGRVHRGDSFTDQAIIDALAAGLSDGDRHVQWQAAHALQRIGPTAFSAEAALQAIVWDPKQPPEVRKMAQEAVETITGAPIRPPWLVEYTQPAPPPPGTAGAPPVD